MLVPNLIKSTPYWNGRVFNLFLWGNVARSKRYVPRIVPPGSPQRVFWDGCRNGGVGFLILCLISRTAPPLAVKRAGKI